ncbi:MAG: hypothetical protein J6U54_22745 [Clostridiales bacterium]|nr:hypothetical protein [Clostridiales bacterium]
MAYKVTETTTVNGQTVDAIWSFDDVESAKARFHSIMSSAYSNENLTYALSTIIDDKGFVIDKERIPEYRPEDEA